MDAKREGKGLDYKGEENNMHAGMVCGLLTRFWGFGGLAFAVCFPGMAYGP